MLIGNNCCCAGECSDICTSGHPASIAVNPTIAGVTNGAGCTGCDTNFNTTHAMTIVQTVNPLELANDVCYDNTASGNLIGTTTCGGSFHNQNMIIRLYKPSGGTSRLRIDLLSAGQTFGRVEYQIPTPVDCTSYGPFTMTVTIAQEIGNCNGTGVSATFTLG